MEQFKEGHELSERQGIWEETLKDLETITDKLGMPIDAGIRETVASFVVNKFPTTGSCEGHIDKEEDGTFTKRSPYVAISVDVPKERFVGEKDIKRLIANKFGVKVGEILQDNGNDAEMAYWEYIQANQIAETVDYVAVRSSNDQLLEDLRALLEEFYKEREVSRFILKKVGPSGYFHLATKKENIKNINDKSLSGFERELAMDQEEINAFGNFLKRKFFNF